jgi:formylglycine-generating enzyme required for sulfatase activity
MSPLTDLPELVGFFSYSREDDDDSHGALTALRERIQRELRGQLGRSMKTFRLWQDKEAIAPGTLWAAEIKAAVAQAVFFIPIITPTVVRSPYCKFELESFLAREAELGRSDLVFPILYIRVPELEDSARQQSDPVLSIIAKRQYLDWREFRHRDVHSTDVKEAVERFCAKICEALQRAWLSPEERRAQEEAAALLRADTEKKAKEAEVNRREYEASEKAALTQARERADEERRRREAEQAKFEAERPPPQRASHSSNRALMIGSLVGAAIIAAIGAWFVVVRPTPPTVTAQQVPSAPGPASTPAPAPLAPTPPAVAPAQPAATPKPIAGVALSLQQERALQPKDTFKECQNCPEMVVVPAGAFTMGSPASEEGRSNDEGPQRKVTFANPFAVGKFALTFDEWDACVADGGCNGYRPDDNGWGRGRQPVINVSWDDAKAYVAWLAKKTRKSYRLLTEAEREYAARAGTTTPFWWGSSISTGQANYDGNYTYGNGVKGEFRERTTQVGSFVPNPWGLYQVHGNVWDWTEDCYHDSYNGAPANGAAWTSGDCSRHVRRGGSWYLYPYYLRSASRDGHPASDQDSYTGLRVGRTLAP